MPDVKERLAVAQWVLERNLAWIAAAEVKVGVIVAIDTAMLGGLATAFGASDATARTVWACLWITSAAGTAVGGVLCAAIAILPRVSGPLRSLLFCGRVAELNREDYAIKFRGVTDTELLDDWVAQIHRNAEIAVMKFAWVRRSLWFSFISVLPWVAAMAMLTKG